MFLECILQLKDHRDTTTGVSLPDAIHIGWYKKKNHPWPQAVIKGRVSRGAAVSAAFSNLGSFYKGWTSYILHSSPIMLLNSSHLNTGAIDFRLSIGLLTRGKIPTEERRDKMCLCLRVVRFLQAQHWLDSFLPEHKSVISPFPYHLFLTLQI